MTGPKRVTEKQLAANRANALASTGPRTPEGKARSRWNALKHGALAQAVIPPALEPFESRAAFEELLDILRAELAPATAMEEVLVERIATSYWRLARLLRAEAAAVADRQLRRRQDDADAELFRTLVSTRRPTGPSLSDRVEHLSNALSNKRQLRSLMAGEDPRWRDASDEDVQAAAQTLFAELQRQLAEEESREESLARDARSIPPISEALNLARYETTLERQIYRALDALERLQRLRGGETLPPPLRLNVDLDVASSEGAADEHAGT